MAEISYINRARIILDLVKDPTVTDLADYANVELLDGPTALKYAQAFWDANGYPHVDLVDGNGDPRDPTNAELSRHYINRIRAYHKEVLSSVRVPAAGQTARDTEVATLATETTTDLGDNES